MRKIPLGSWSRETKDLGEPRKITKWYGKQWDNKGYYEKRIINGSQDPEDGKKEEEEWILKSWSLWLNVEDKNTKFVHNQYKERMRKNIIKELDNERG